MIKPSTTNPWLRYPLMVIWAFTEVHCDSSSKQRELDARAAEQTAKEEALAAEQKALAAQKRALDAEQEAARARDESKKAGDDAQPQVGEGAPSRPRSGRVTATVSVAFDESKADGAVWDVGLGPQPDPVLAARVESSGKTLAFNGPDNTLWASTTWDVDMAAADSLTITCYDEDLAANDTGGTFVARFEGRKGTREGRAGTVHFSVEFSEPR